MITYIDISKTFTIIKKIGKGTYGEVYHVTKDNNNYALKLVEDTNDNVVSPTTLKEISSLKKLQHPNIIKIIDIFLGELDDKEYICILMELGQYQLVDIGSLCNNVEERKAIFYKLLDVMNYIHKSGYYHGDLSINNVVYNNNNDIKIIDFGFSNRKYRKLNQNLIPSLFSRPIELICQKGLHMKHDKIDSWSLGTVMYFVMTDTILFTETNENNVKNICNSIIDVCGTIPSGIAQKLGIDCKIVENGLCGYNIVDDKIRLILSQLLDYNFRTRMNIIDVCNANNIKSDDIKKIYQSCSKYVDIPENVLIKIMTLITNIIKMNDLEDEILFLTITNMYRLKYDKFLMSLVNGDLIIISIVMFWLTSKIISRKIFYRKDILKIISCYTNKKYNIENIHNAICFELDWDIDSPTIYNQIINIPKRYRRYYKILHLIMIVHPLFFRYSELSKSITIYKVLHNYFKFEQSVTKDFLNNCAYNYRINTHEVKTCYNNLIEIIKKISNNIKYDVVNDITVFIKGYLEIYNYENGILWLYDLSRTKCENFSL